MLNYLQYNAASGDNYVGIEKTEDQQWLCVGKSYEEAITVGLEEAGGGVQDGYY